MKIWKVFGLVAVLTAATVHAQLGSAAAQSEGDPRVKKLLDETGLAYQVDRDGDYRIVLEFPDDNGRSQLLFVDSKTHSYRSLEVREVWSVGYTSATDIPAAVMRRLLEDNALTILGQWSISEQFGKKAAIFRVHLDANTDAATLRSVVELVAGKADDMEKELLGALSDDL